MTASRHWQIWNTYLIIDEMSIVSDVGYFLIARTHLLEAAYIRLLLEILDSFLPYYDGMVKELVCSTALVRQRRT